MRMKYFTCTAFIILISAVYCSAAPIFPFFNPFQVNPSTESTTQSTTTNEVTTESIANEAAGLINPFQPSGTSESSFLQDGQSKLPQLLMTPLEILQLLFGPHNGHTNGGLPGLEFPSTSTTQSESHPGLLPGFSGLPSIPGIQLPIPLIGLPTLVATNSQPYFLERSYNESTPNLDENSTSTTKN